MVLYYLEDKQDEHPGNKCKDVLEMASKSSTVNHRHSIITQLNRNILRTLNILKLKLTL